MLAKGGIEPAGLPTWARPPLQRCMEKRGYPLRSTSSVNVAATGRSELQRLVISFSQAISRQSRKLACAAADPRARRVISRKFRFTQAGTVGAAVEAKGRPEQK